MSTDLPSIAHPPDSSSSFIERNLLDHITNTQEEDTTIPSSPPSSPLGQFHRPILKLNNSNKRHISRHGTDLVDNQPMRKERKIKFMDDDNEDEFAIDNDGHVYGYLLKSDKLPSNYKPKLYDEPTYFVVDNDRNLKMSTGSMLNSMFDNAENLIDFKLNELNINLNQLGLNSIPNQLFDFDHYRSSFNSNLNQPNLLIDLSDNKLRSISPKVFTLKNLKMLSFRNNKIARLPGKIDHAVNLKNLNLGLNKFKFLPHNILNLNNLEVLAIGHNNNLIKFNNINNKVSMIDENLLKLSNDTNLTDVDKDIKYFTDIHWISSSPSQKLINKSNIPKINRTLTTLQDEAYNENGIFTPFTTKSTVIAPWTPKLSELILREISNYKISSSEISNWKLDTPMRIYDKSMKALIYGSNGETCGYCENVCIESCGEMLEWWDFKGCKLVTIKRRFCSRSCGLNWIEKLDMIKSKC